MIRAVETHTTLLETQRLEVIPIQALVGHLTLMEAKHTEPIQTAIHGTITLKPAITIIQTELAVMEKASLELATKELKMKSLIIAILLMPSLLYAKQANVGTQNGRFQLIQLSEMRRDQFMIDTQTGKIWSKSCAIGEGADCDMSAWMPDNVVGVNISESEYFKKVREVKKYIEDQKKLQNSQASN